MALTEKRTVLCTAISAIGAFFYILVSLLQANVPIWRISLLAGIAMLCFTVFLNVKKTNHSLWGVLILFYSNVGFLPFGFASEIYLMNYLLSFGIIAYVFGLISAALMLSSESLKIPSNA